MTAPRVSGPHRRGQASRRPWVAAAMFVPALALAGCSSSGGREPAAQGEGGGEVAQAERMKVAMATHATPGDTFWDRIRAGAEEASAKDNVDFLYASDPEGGRQAQLVQQYIDQDVDGIAVTLAKRDLRHGGNRTVRMGEDRKGTAGGRVDDSNSAVLSGGPPRPDPVAWGPRAPPHGLAEPSAIV